MIVEMLSIVLQQNMKKKGGDYNYFLDFIKPYIKKRYPFDFYRISEEKNISKDIDHMKKIKG